MVELDRLRTVATDGAGYGAGGSPTMLEFGIRHTALREALERAGVDLGVLDRSVVQRLARLDATTVQVLIGIISRANGGGGG